MSSLYTFNQYERDIPFKLGERLPDKVNHNIFISNDPKIANPQPILTIQNFITEEERLHLLSETRGKFRSLEGEYLPSQRESERCLILSDVLIEPLYKRIEQLMEKHEDIRQMLTADHLRPQGFKVLGTWEPQKLNNCSRFIRYPENSIGVVAHRDSTSIFDVITRSIMTIIIYLDDDYEGGETRFLLSHGRREENELVAEEIESGTEEYYTYKPVKCSAAIFHHNIIHEGRPIRGAEKNIIRNDIVYKNVAPTEQDSQFESYKEACNYFMKAVQQQRDGKVALASEYYERSASIRQFQDKTYMHLKNVDSSEDGESS